MINALRLFLPGLVLCAATMPAQTQPRIFNTVKQKLAAGKQVEER